MCVRVREHQEQLSSWLEDLEKESKWTEAHMASLKKRQANLTVSAKRIILKVQSVTFHFIYTMGDTQGFPCSDLPLLFTSTPKAGGCFCT